MQEDANHQQGEDNGKHEVDDGAVWHVMELNVVAVIGKHPNKSEVLKDHHDEDNKNDNL